jgi:hypothetical protein
MLLKENELIEIVRECVIRTLKESNIKSTSQKDSKDDEDARLSDMNTETGKESETRSSIESYFKLPGVNNAPYAYKLYGVTPEKGKDTNKMKNARKKFSDNLRHIKNDNGYDYAFSSDELNKLKNMISNTQLSEAIDKAFKKIIKNK